VDGREQRAIIASILTVSHFFSPQIRVSKTRAVVGLMRPETELKNAVWQYETPKDKAQNIKDYYAFCESCVYWEFLGAMFASGYILRRWLGELGVKIRIKTDLNLASL
jgi:hypothetical protein